MIYPKLLIETSMWHSIIDTKVSLIHNIFICAVYTRQSILSVNVKIRLLDEFPLNYIHICAYVLCDAVILVLIYAFHASLDSHCCRRFYWEFILRMETDISRFFFLSFELCWLGFHGSFVVGFIRYPNKFRIDFIMAISSFNLLAIASFFSKKNLLQRNIRYRYWFTACWYRSMPAKERRCTATQHLRRNW